MCVSVPKGKSNEKTLEPKTVEQIKNECGYGKSLQHCCHILTESLENNVSKVCSQVPMSQTTYITIARSSTFVGHVGSHSCRARQKSAIAATNNKSQPRRHQTPRTPLTVRFIQPRLIPCTIREPPIRPSNSHIQNQIERCTSISFKYPKTKRKQSHIDQTAPPWSHSPTDYQE